MITKSDYNNSEKDEISNITDKDTKKKELWTSNSTIKVDIPCSLVLLNLSTLNFIKQKSILLPIPSILDLAKHNFQSSSNWTKPKEDQYLANSSSNDQFATNIKNNNKDNNVVAIIERFLFNIRYRLSYKRWIEKKYKKLANFLYIPRSK